MSRPLAVLDACVLFPFQLRNLLLHLAVFGLYTPLWSETIMEECRRNLLSTGRCTEDQVAHLGSRMRQSFSEAWGAGFEHLISTLSLPDPNDNHVLALAIHYEAELIVTKNLRHFPREVLHNYGIKPVPPDRFVQDLFAENPAAVCEAAEAHRTSLTRSPLTRSAYLAALEQAELPGAAERIRTCPQREVE